MRLNLLSLLLLSLSNPAMAKSADEALPSPVSLAVTPAQRISFSAIGLPPGLSINPSTGVITGVIERAALYGQSTAFDAIVRVRTDDGGSGESRFRITIKNNVPIAVDDRLVIDDHTKSISINVLANDSDPDGDALTIVSVTAAHGTVLQYSRDGLSYLPNRDFTGTDTIQYSVSDGFGGTASAIVNVVAKARH
jgi:large repetitive protein